MNISKVTQPIQNFTWKWEYSFLINQTWFCCIHQFWDICPELSIQWVKYSKLIKKNEEMMTIDNDDVVVDENHVLSTI